MDGHGCEGEQGVKNNGIKDAAPRSLSTDQWRDQALSRSNCYGLSALVFRDTPTGDLVTQLRDPPLTEALSALGYDVDKYLAGELEAVTASLQEQFTQTFLGPGPHVSLYASIHTDGVGQLWGDSTVWVKRFIEQTGLCFRNDWDSIPDHIAI